MPLTYAAACKDGLSVCALVCRRELGDMECDRQGHIWRAAQRR